MISSNKIEQVLSSWHPGYVGHAIVYMPPGWKNKLPVPYLFVYVSSELTLDEYVSFFRCCALNKLNNARLFTPRTLQYASCFHPSFYHAVQKSKEHSSAALRIHLEQMNSLRMSESVSPQLHVATVNYWLQSVIFLAGVTLSAALIQNRWSVGTLESKLNRLWQLGMYKDVAGLEPLRELEAEEFVLTCADSLNSNPAAVLKELKLFYSKALKLLVKDIPSSSVELKETKLTALQKERFGFVKNLKSLLGKNVQCIILYGSAVNSVQFADYDLIVVVKDLNKALDAIAGKSPTYNGLELNISLFDETDFWHYQLASGDNLADHALCLYGSIMVPQKAVGDLVARNYSFGFVRFRQQMGMASHFGSVASDSDDKLNLMNYFIKIPLNVFKGIQGCYGTVGTNEELKKWAKTTIGFNVDKEQLKSQQGFSMDALAAATWATQEVMHSFDKTHHIFNKVQTIQYDHQLLKK